MLIEFSEHRPAAPLMPGAARAGNARAGRRPPGFGYAGRP